MDPAEANVDFSHGRQEEATSGGKRSGSGSPDKYERCVQDCGNHESLALNTNTTQKEGFMSYKRFVQQLEDDVLPPEAERRYQEYKDNVSTQKRTFFKTHKTEKWLQDKFHPTNMVYLIQRRIDAAEVKALDDLVRKVNHETYGWKYGCGVEGCPKLFHAAEFVHTHLKRKHSELVTELTSEVIEKIYFENYMKDVDAPYGSTVPAIDEQAVVHSGGGLGSNDRPGAPQGGDHTNDAMRCNNSFGPLSSSALWRPPPFLMPVPGAGPLGPFVAAPPPCRNNGAHRDWGSGGRAVRPRGPIRPVNPLSKHDSQRKIIYQDLDAPKDEASVIDYRSV